MRCERGNSSNESLTCESLLSEFQFFVFRITTPQSGWSSHEKTIKVEKGSTQSEESRDQFLDVIYWLRQLVALILGLTFGIFGLKGFFALSLYASLNAGVLFLYWSLFQKIDEEEFGGSWELTKEGFMTSTAVFVVNWIIFYTGIHASPSLLTLGEDSSHHSSLFSDEFID